MALDRLDRVHQRRIDRNAAEVLRGLEAGIDHVDDENARRAEKLSTQRPHEPDRSGSYDRHDVTRLYLGALGTEEAGGQDVADEDGLFVGHALGDELHRMVGQWHDDVLGLAAAEVTEVFTVAEGGLADALVEPSLAAQSAGAAGREEARHDAVARSEALDLRAGILDHTDEFVSEDCPRTPWCVAMKDGQDRAADGAESHLDQSIGRTLDGRLRHVDYLDVPFTLKSQRLHSADS